MEHSKDHNLEVQWVMLSFERDIIEKFNACLGGWGREDPWELKEHRALHGVTQSLTT